MKIIIQTPRLLASDSLLEFVRTKVEKLAAYSDESEEVRVILRIDSSSEQKNKICEITGVVSGTGLFAAKQEGSFEEAVFHAVDTLRKQLARHRDGKDDVQNTSQSA